MDISFPGVDHVYGIPEHADSFLLKTTTYVCFLLLLIFDSLPPLLSSLLSLCVSLFP